MEAKQENLNLPTITPPPENTEPSANEMQSQNSNSATNKLPSLSVSLPQSENEQRLAQARDELNRKAAESRSGRKKPEQSSSIEALNAVAAKTEAQEKIKRPVGRPKKSEEEKKPKVEQVIVEEVLELSEEDVIDFLEISDVILEKFKIEKLSLKEKKLIAQPSARLLKKYFSTKIGKFSDEAKLGTALAAIVISRLNIGGEQSNTDIREKGTRENDTSQRVVPFGKAAAGN